MESQSSDEESPTPSSGMKRRGHSELADQEREKKARKLTEKVMETIRQIKEKHKGGKMPKIIVFCSRRSKKVSENQPKTNEENQEDSASASEDSASASEDSRSASEEFLSESEEYPSETEESPSESEGSPSTPHQPETKDP